MCCGSPIVVYVEVCVENTGEGNSDEVEKASCASWILQCSNQNCIYPRLKKGL